MAMAKRRMSTISSSPTSSAPTRAANAFTLDWSGLREGITLVCPILEAVRLEFGAAHFLKRHHERGCDFIDGKVFRIGVMKDKLSGFLCLTCPEGQDQERCFLLVDTRLAVRVKPKERFFFGVETDAKQVATGGGLHLLRFDKDNSFVHVFMQDGSVLLVERKLGRLVQRKLDFASQVNLRLAQAEKVYSAALKIEGDNGIVAQDSALHQIVAIAATAHRLAPDVAKEALSILSRNAKDLRPCVREHATKALNPEQRQLLWPSRPLVTIGQARKAATSLNQRKGGYLRLVDLKEEIEKVA